MQNPAPQMQQEPLPFMKVWTMIQMQSIPTPSGDRSLDPGPEKRLLRTPTLNQWSLDLGSTQEVDGPEKRLLPPVMGVHSSDLNKLKVEVRVEAQALYHHRVPVLLLLPRLAKGSPTPCPELENRMHQKEASIDRFIQHLLH
ncbi:hypothetical protein OPV22_033649 [Ensete ventricosum]|uniref:Uncharacterized protein n=1 Tax=Ensete ventricosum TaxID=4639 RepID=A0AAV8PUX3_ENSVE|nr:hypothetical protein OPV22_033649 [Ensete ventricosum]